MKILVTGGAGYIGSVLVEQLLADGHTVTVIDNFMYRQWSLGHVCHNTRLKIERLDVRNQAEVLRLAKHADAIIPLAGIVGAPACLRDPTAAESINQSAQIGLIQNLSASQMVLMPTTNSGYGTTKRGAITDETSPLNPLSDYARHKVAVEKILMERENSISFRLATVFGISPRMRLDLLVNDFCYRAVRDGFLVLFEAHFRRNYLHVRDVSGVFRHGLQNFSAMKGQIYNVGLSEANLTKLELCERIKAVVPNFYFTEALVGRDPDRRDYEISNAKIEASGWQPAHGLTQGIQELVGGFTMMSGHPFSNL